MLKRTEGISDALKKPVEAIDKSIAGRICGFLGFIVAVLLCNTVFSRFYLSDSEIYLIATISALLTGGLARLIVKRISQ